MNWLNVSVHITNNQQSLEKMVLASPNGRYPLVKDQTGVSLIMADAAASVFQGLVWAAGAFDYNLVMLERPLRLNIMYFTWKFMLQVSSCQNNET